MNPEGEQDMSHDNYKYMVNFVIDVKRTDNEMLSLSENDMVREMQTATELAIAQVMKKHGMNNKKHLGSTRVSY